jgi:predicted transcriptional regulator of viral defense system
MNDNEAVIKLLDDNNGFVTAAQVTAAGIQRRTLSSLVDAKVIYRAARGIYALPETWEDEMYFLQYQYSKGVFSNDTALYLHGMSDRTPINYTLTFPYGYNAPSLRKQNVKIKHVTCETYGLGISEMPSPCGNPLKVYDVERTLCDIVKGNNTCDIQIVNQAMKTYATSKAKDIAKLMDYAEKLKAKPKILRYMEVLL